MESARAGSLNPDGMPDPFSKSASVDIFATTRWSVVLKAGGPAEEAQSALEKLCRTYWFPLYGYVRRRGIDEHEAQDMTQEFFARLLNGSGLQTVRPEKGRFRAFLLASIKNFLANEWRDARRLKRGGGKEFLSWDALDAEDRYGKEPADAIDAESWYDRHWAQNVVETALSRLGSEMDEQGLRERYATLKPFLQGDGGGRSYADAAKKAGLSESATKTAIFRMRRRYGELIRDEIAQTVTSPAEVEEEIQALIALLGSA